MKDLRFEKGLELLNTIDGEAGHQVINSLKDICPALAKMTIAFPFGDIYSRDGLDLRSREIATVAALTAMGSCLPQLKVHLNAALNVGVTEDELKEIIIQMAGYAGFPAALNGMFMLKEVLATR